MKPGRPEQLILLGVFALGLFFAVFFGIHAVACNSEGGAYVETVYGWPTCLGGNA